MSLLLLFAGAKTGGRPASTKVVGWRIPLEQFREILRAQGSPWADELADTCEKLEKRKAKKQGKKKLAEVFDEVLEEIAEHISTPVDWGPIVVSIQAALSATRTTLALKHAQIALNLLQEDDDAMILLLQ